MYEYFGGVPCVTVPDNLKTGVIKAHRYDPDLNPDYHELAKHYVTSIVPARVRSPKDKALVEGAVKIIMRYFRFVNRRRTFTSIAEINRALRDAYEKINSREHTRFKVSRKDRFLTLEKASLRPLPLEPFSIGEWKLAKIHPDCTIQSDHNFYSAPHIHRGEEVRVKTSETQVEMFLDLDRIAVHARALGKVGSRVIDKTHLPENSRAYLEATPTHILQQAQFVNATLYCFIDELFKADTLGNIRKAQGFVRVAHSTIKNNGRELGSHWIEQSIVSMSLFNKVRVAQFEALLKNEFKKYKQVPTLADRSITRKPGNPTLRGTESADVARCNQLNSQQPLPMEVVNQ